LLSLNIQGQYKDTLRWVGHGGSERIECRGWKPNQIQDGALKIINERLLGMSDDEVVGYLSHLPIRYMALGNGQPATKPYDQNQLESEFERVAVSGSFATFLDGSGNPLNPQAPSARFMLQVVLGAAEGNGDLREFGLFGGEATDTLNSGTMFNWITHDLIQKTPLLVVNRVIDISLSINRS